MDALQLLRIIGSRPVFINPSGCDTFERNRLRGTAKHGIRPVMLPAQLQLQCNRTPQGLSAESLYQQVHTRTCTAVRIDPRLTGNQPAWLDAALFYQVVLDRLIPPVRQPDQLIIRHLDVR